MNTHCSRLRGTTLALLIAVLATACGGGSSNEVAPEPEPVPPAPPSTSVERDVQPSAVDAAVDPTENQPHFTVTPSPAATRRHRLFVMLPGTDGDPSMYRYVVRAGASRGYHAVGLDYSNAAAIGRICALSSDENCFWNARREAITGQDLSGELAIAPPDAIVPRLVNLLRHLHQQHPGEGWDEFLSSDSVVWSKVVVAGHSQGGGHAGVIAKLFSLDRAVYFSSPADWDLRADAPAAWMSRGSQTPASRQYGFSHLGDQLVPYDELRQNWSIMGLAALGSPVSVDSTGDYGGSHMLTTAAAPAPTSINDAEHGAPVLDIVTPLAANGTPLYVPVWNYLAFP